MIHEALIHLSNRSDESEMALQDLQSFMHPGEKELINRILDIASLSQFIEHFCNHISKPELLNNSVNSSSDSKLPSGIYINAFANGISIVLTDYRQDIVKLEDMFLQNPQLSLTFVRGYLDRYLILFQMIKTMINAIEKDNVRGCLLMGKVHKYVKCGIKPIADAADKIIGVLNTSFYRQLCNWIIYGDLIDEYQDFFICDGKCADEDFLYPEQIEESSGSAAGALTRRIKIQRPPPVRKFFINWSMVPTFIREDTIESILFMGRIVWILRNDPKKVKNDQYQTKCKRDIWEGKDTEYYMKVQNLGTHNFNPFEFQNTIEECRVKLTQYLWSVMLEEGHLKEHLQLIREYYALGRGELFNQFITMAENNIKNPASEHLADKLNSMFLETARKIYGENDKSYLKFELSTTESDKQTGTNFWPQVQLNFEISWPLHIIFHPKSMILYNKLFSFLLRLKKTQNNLNKLWRMHVATKQNIDRRLWTLRQHLTFLVNNLQYLLQDVIETEFSTLINAVNNAIEFEDIIKVHHEFISNLLSKSFILIPDETLAFQNKHKLHQTPAVKVNSPTKVYNVITRLLSLCDDFCVVASCWDIDLTEPELADLEKFQKKTDEVVDSLLFILYSVHEKSNGHPLQLLHQLDFNRYFSKNKPDFNLTAAS